MSAAEVIAAHQWMFDNRYYCTCRALLEYDGQVDQAAEEAMAAHVLDALKAARFAVVELPEPDELRHGFALEVRRGRVLDHGPLDAYQPQDARDFAGALLAAADAAEATP